MHTLLNLQQLLLHTAKILCGKTREQLRAVKVDIDEETRTLHFWYYYDGEISEDDQMLLNIVTQVVTKSIRLDFPQPYKVAEAIVRLDYPHPIPDEGYYVYLRDETYFKDGSLPSPSIQNSNYFNKELSDALNLQLLSIFALLGRVQPNLRNFSIDIDEFNSTCYFSFSFDGEISEKDNLIAQAIVHDVMSHFYQDYTSAVEIERIDSPENISSNRTAIYSKDETFDLEDEIAAEERESRWFCLESQEEILHNEQLFSSHGLLKLIRNSLVFMIGQNFRSIQVSINQLKRHAKVWLHYDGLPSGLETSMVTAINDAAIHSEYTIEFHLEQLDTPLPIPHLGQFLFMQNESPNKLPSTYDSEKVHLDKLKAFISSQASLLWREEPIKRNPYLRAIKFDVCDYDKTFIVLFAFNLAYTVADENKAQRLAEEIKSKFFPKYTHNTFLARYDYEEAIPVIGNTAYSCPGENTSNLSTKDAFSEAVTAALVGKIFPELRAVKIDLNERKKQVYFWFYYANEISEEEQIQAYAVANLSLPPDYAQNIELRQLDEERPIPSIGWFIYCRYER